MCTWVVLLQFSYNQDEWARQKKIVHRETVVNSEYTHAGEECIKKDYWLKKHLFAEMTNCLLNKNESLKTNHVPIYLPSRSFTQKIY